MRSELDSMITSLRYDPPVVPLPTGSAAAARAATSALASLVKDSSVWTCFSLSGSRQMLIDSMPDGPPLAQPQLATCTMKIEATPPPALADDAQPAPREARSECRSGRDLHRVGKPRRHAWRDERWTTRPIGLRWPSQTGVVRSRGIIAMVVALKATLAPSSGVRA